ncbi:hypothetical protein D3C80_1070450 [compost metagenome]
MGRLHDQALGQHRRRRGRRNTLATLDTRKSQAALDQLARQDQRQLARRIAVDEIARQGRVDQGDIARQQLNAVAGLLHEGAPAELKGRVIVRAFIARQFAFGSVQARLGNIHHAQFDRACAKFIDGPGELSAQGLGTERATDLIDLVQPLVEPVHS